MVGPSSEFTCGAGRSGPGSQRDGQSVVHESGHGVQKRGSGCGENCNSQAWLSELAQTEQGVRSDDWDVVARVHESAGIRLWNH